MKIYNAFIKKNKEGKVEDIVFVKEGFSFFAFLFSGLWFLYHKMWSEFFVFLLASTALSYGFEFIPEFDKFFLELAFVFIVALNANYWLCENLKNKNYEFVGLVFGGNRTEAKIRFVKNLEADVSASAIEFDDSILNPKLHHQMMKLKKPKHSSL
jgi:hypothetical protein